jgi:predicted nuclease of predicted toxin-antitoxin system
MGWQPIHMPNEAEVSAFVREVGKKARFLVDESVGVGVSDLLRSSGWNVKYVAEAGLTGQGDEDVLAFALRDDRVLLTHDRDFLNNRRFPEHRNPGLVVLPGGSGDAVALVESLKWTLSIVGEFRELWRKSKVEVSGGGKFTVTSREADTGRVTTTRYWAVPNGSVLEWEDE